MHIIKFKIKKLNTETVCFLHLSKQNTEFCLKVNFFLLFSKDNKTFLNTNNNK